MNHAEAMHVPQATCNVNQLNRTSAKLCSRDRGVTHKLSPVYMTVLLDKLVDVPMFHPLRDHRESPVTYRHSKQW
jgi:hypothetical protein